MVTKSEARDLPYSDESITDASFEAGVNDDEDVPPGVNAEVATAEVGEDGKLADVVAVVIGQVPDPTRRTSKAKPEMNLHDGTEDAEVHKATEVRIVARTSGSRDGPTLMDWRNIRDLRRDDISAIDVLTPSFPIVREGRFLAVQVRNQSTQIHPLFSGESSEFGFPIQAAEG